MGGNLEDFVEPLEIPVLNTQDHMGMFVIVNKLGMMLRMRENMFMAYVQSDKSFGTFLKSFMNLRGNVSIKEEQKSDQEQRNLLYTIDNEILEILHRMASVFEKSDGKQSFKVFGLLSVCDLLFLSAHFIGIDKKKAKYVFQLLDQVLIGKTEILAQSVWEMLHFSLSLSERGVFLQFEEQMEYFVSFSKVIDGLTTCIPQCIPLLTRMNGFMGDLIVLYEKVSLEVCNGDMRHLEVMRSHLLESVWNVVQYFKTKEDQLEHLVFTLCAESSIVCHQSSSDHKFALLIHLQRKFNLLQLLRIKMNSTSIGLEHISGILNDTSTFQVSKESVDSVESLKQLFEGLTDEMAMKCLKYYGWDYEKTVNSILENGLPHHLQTKMSSNTMLQASENVEFRKFLESTGKGEKDGTITDELDFDLPKDQLNALKQRIHDIGFESDDEDQIEVSPAFSLDKVVEAEEEIERPQVPSRDPNREKIYRKNKEKNKGKHRKQKAMRKFQQAL